VCDLTSDAARTSLGELFWFSNQVPPPTGAEATNKTWEYLQACHELLKLDVYPMIKSKAWILL